MRFAGQVKMPINTQFIEELKIIESVFGEKVTIDDMKVAARQALELGTQKGTSLFLVDCTHLVKGGTIVQLYSMGDYYEKLNLLPGIKQAVVLSKAIGVQRDIRFYETATRNRGYDVRVFADRSEAIAWLLHD